MVIQKDRVVSIEYELKDATGVVIDASGEGDPLVYLHGNQNLIPGLERELEGKKAKDTVKCVVPAADGYGKHDESLVFKVSREDFAEPEKIQVGMQFQAHQEDGSHQVVTVVGIDSKEITVDANHPLAGKDLHFSVTICDVREATKEELEHGHVHGADSCGCGGECGDDCDCEGDCEEDESGCGCGGCR